jgi:hypothetical protein
MDGLGTNTPGLFEFWDGADKQTDFRLLEVAISDRAIR